jgi:hypothetical protein
MDDNQAFAHSAANTSAYSASNDKQPSAHACSCVGASAIEDADFTVSHCEACKISSKSFTDNYIATISCA